MTTVSGEPLVSLKEKLTVKYVMNKFAVKPIGLTITKSHIKKMVERESSKLIKDVYWYLSAIPLIVGEKNTFFIFAIEIIFSVKSVNIYLFRSEFDYPLRKGRIPLNINIFIFTCLVKEDTILNKYNLVLSSWSSSSIGCGNEQNRSVNCNALSGVWAVS